ncbi:hypothetical protein ACFLS5_03300 [Candidatus Bipolaricaulota bacterium]
MKHYRNVVLVAILGLGIGLPAMAQQASTVFDIEPGVSMLGAGAAGISVANGAESLYYNPATLAALPGISFSSFYASYLGLANYSALSLTFRNWGIAALLLNSGGIDGYDADGNATETIAYGNTGILFGVGIDPSILPFIPDFAFDFSLGARVKYLSVRLAEETGSGFSFDLGFRTTIPDIRLGPVSVTDIAFGVTAVNLFGSISYDVEQDNFLMDLKVGASARLADAFLLALDLHLGGSAQVGLVYSPVPSLDLRLGVISRGTISWTAGVGLNVEGFLIDYAFASHRAGGTHRVSLTLDFSSLDIRALSSSLRRILP